MRARDDLGDPSRPIEPNRVGLYVDGFDFVFNGQGRPRPPRATPAPGLL